MTNLDTLNFLVDYDNLDVSLRSTGIVNLANRIIAQTPPSFLTPYQKLSMRLYGGWHSQGFSKTRSAQQLSAELSREFPSPQIARAPGVSGQVFRLDVSLAEGPINNLHVRFDETFKKRRGMRPIWLDLNGRTPCPAPTGTCPIDSFEAVVTRKACVTPSCSITLQDVVRHAEQKIVDTLIVADLIVLAMQYKHSHSVLVSSDVDLWPAVLVATQSACSVLQLHTTSGGKTQRRLLNTLNGIQQRLYIQSSV